jgi:signal transduction histidine kinase
VAPNEDQPTPASRAPGGAPPVGSRPDDDRHWPLWVYFVALGALAVGTAAAAAIFLSVQASRDAHRSAERNARFAAAHAAGRLAKSISEMNATVAGVAQTLQGKAIPAKLTAACALSYSGSDALPSGHVEIVRTNGVVVCSSRPHAGLASLPGYAGAQWLRRAAAGRVFIAPIHDRATGRLALVSAAPVGKSAVVAAFADLQPIARSLGALYGGGLPNEFLVTTADGRTVLSRSVAPARWAGAPLPPAALPPQTGGSHRDVDRVSRIYEQAQVPAVGWRLYVGEDQHAALASGTTLRNRELAILLAGVLAVILASFVIFRRVALPIRRLAAAVRASGPDSPTASVPVAGPVEVASLGASINGLIEAVDRELNERRQLEEELRHVQKMDALGRVVAGVAHDFNNLVTVIAGFTSLILKSVRGDDAVRQHAEEVTRAAEGARMLVQQLLVFSRKDAPTPTVLDGNVVLREMESMLTRVLGPNITIATRLAPAPVVMRADRGQLQQVVMNLSVNARDAMPDGGALTLTSEQRVLDEQAARPLGLAPGSYAVIGVGDTGTGMDAETKERLFEPFFTTKSAGEGTGLGLATCYGIVSQLGGRIDVESELGEGSTFTIYLPLAEAPVDLPREPEAAAPRTSRGETILLVEDDDGLRALTRIVLEEAGYIVLEAPAGEAGLAVAAEHDDPIDLLLTDGVMAAMTGRDLAEQFGARYPGTKIVHMSGYEPGTLPAYDEVPADAFLAKPFTPEALLLTIRNALDAAPS